MTIWAPREFHWDWNVLCSIHIYINAKDFIVKKLRLEKLYWHAYCTHHNEQVVPQKVSALFVFIKLITCSYLLCLVLAMDFAVWTQHSCRMLQTLVELMQAHCLRGSNSFGGDVLHWESGEERQPVLNCPFHFFCTWIHKYVWYFLSKCFKYVTFLSSTYTALRIC